MPYQYDAFFSYKRDPESDAWHEKVKSKLEYWLKQELGRRDVRIFIDSEDIPNGARWPQRLADALRHSRCIVCIWSPLYFQSKYCVSEWMTFVQREELAHRDLVMPASYFDGEKFPEDARSRQFDDFKDFTSTIPKFWETAGAVDFEAKLKRFAHDLAAMIERAPAYDDGFPVVEATDAQVAPEGTIERVANG